MKLLHLEVENYGLFSRRSLDLDRGFQLLHGPNEAGKSTLLQLVREMLFGFPIKNRYHFETHAGEMAGEAIAEMADGRRIRFRRRRGRGPTLTGEIETTGQSIEADQLQRLLGPANAELYQHVFGFSLAELVAGREILRHASFSEALFGTGLGGVANFKRVREALAEEQKQLFVPSGKNPTINRLLRQLREAKTRSRESVVKPQEYEKRRDELARLKADAESLRRELDALRREQARHERLARAHPPWRELAAANQELAALHVPAELPGDADERFERITERRQSLGRELDELRRQLAENRERLSRLAPSSAVIERAAELRRLAEDVQRVVGFRRDLPERRGEARELAAAIEHQLRELDPSWNLQHLEQFRATLEQREILDRLGGEREELQTKATRLAAEQATLDRDLEQASANLRRLDESLAPAHGEGPLASIDSLEEVEAGSRRYAEDRKSAAARQEERIGLQAESDLLESRLAAAVKRQPPLLPDLPVPMDATVARFREDFQDARRERTQAESDWRDARDQRERCDAELAMLEARESVPSRDALLTLRRERDAIWTMLRAKLVDHAAGAESVSRSPSELADALETSVAAADRTADERQEKAELVATRDQLVAELDRTRRREQTAHARFEETRLTESTLSADWRRQWLDSGLEPLDPAAMLDWLRDYADFRRLAVQRRKVGEQLARLEQRMDGFGDQLRRLFPGTTATVEALVKRAARQLDAARKAAIQRPMYVAEIEEKQSRRRAVDQRQQQHARDAAAWEARWTERLSAWRFPTHWDVSLCERVWAELAEAREKQERVRALEARCLDMASGLSRFEEAVRAACEGLAPDLTRQPAEEAARQLAERLERAQQNERDRVHLSTTIERLEREVVAKERQSTQANDDARRLLELAGVQRDEQFAPVADLARRRGQLQQTVRERQQELRVLFGADEASIPSELQGVDPLAVQERMRELTMELQRTEQLYEQTRDDEREAEREIESWSRASDTLEHSLELESLRGQLAEAVDRWAPLVLAQSLLARALERFERERKPRLLERTARFFERLTLGRYVSLDRKLDEEGTLLVVAHDGSRKEPGELSTGTREQLYLALRLAYIENYCQDAEPLPIVVDDILVNFDAERTRQTLDVLLEMSETCQVLFLTCHEHVLQLVREMHPSVEPIRWETSPHSPVTVTAQRVTLRAR